MKTSSGSAAAVLLICSIVGLSFSPAAAADSHPSPYGDFNMLPKDIGLLINFSVPCDLNSAIAIPDAGGLLRPVLMAAGYQEYKYDGSKWVYVNQEASLFNKTLAKVGRIFGVSDGRITFEISANQRELGTGAAVGKITGKPVVSVYQMFSLPLQLIKLSSYENGSNYFSSHYVQRFGTQLGLPPGKTFAAKAGDTFKSRFSAFYAFYLPIDLSIQLAVRVPRCGDERFYGIEFGRLNQP